MSCIGTGYIRTVQGPHGPVRRTVIIIKEGVLNGKGDSTSRSKM